VSKGENSTMKIRLGIETRRRRSIARNAWPKVKTEFSRRHVLPSLNRQVPSVYLRRQDALGRTVGTSYRRSTSKAKDIL